MHTVQNSTPIVFYILLRFMV